MISALNPLREITFFPVLLRLLVATFCGTLIGLERSSKNRPAGFRTHILVCLAACVASLTGHFLYLGLKLPVDVSRISGQIITGLGFIGAGTIIVTKKLSIKGLTTAAGLWTTGIIGLAIGSGFYEGGIIGTVLVLLAETLFARLGSYIPRSPEFVLELMYNEKTALDHVLRHCKNKHMNIKSLQIRTPGNQDNSFCATITLRTDGKPVKQLLDELLQIPGILSAAWL